MINFYQQNRRNLIDQLNNYSLVIIYSGEAPLKSGSERYPFSVNKNFYYLTGINQAGSILVLYKLNNQIHEHLFIPKDDSRNIRFDGMFLSKANASEMSNIAEVLHLEQFSDTINKVFKYPVSVYLDLERHFFSEPDSLALSFAKDLEKKYPSIKIYNVFNHLAKLRMIKNELEIDLIKQAINKVEIAINQTIKMIVPNVEEVSLNNEFIYNLKKAGADDIAFNPIIGSGANGLILHAQPRHKKFGVHELVILDVGAEVSLYKSDIARCIPVDTKFSEEQAQLVTLVIEVQEALIKLVKPGLNLHDLNLAASKMLATRLLELKLISSLQEIDQVFNHSVAHHIGLDTHDATIINEPLAINNVITIEPGIYLKNKNIGIRIEDMLLVTEKGNIVLSNKIAKYPKEIEALKRGELNGK
jgi:Xaa-Pro aminopeptidase